MPTTNNKVFTLPSLLSTTDSRSGNCRSSPIFLLAPNSSAFVLFVSRTALQSNALCGGKLGPEFFFFFFFKKKVCGPLTQQRMAAEDQIK